MVRSDPALAVRLKGLEPRIAGLQERAERSDSH